MSCAGVCTLCGFNRNSRLCTCLDRVRNNDPFHPQLADIESAIRDNMYFGRDAYDTALESIAAVKAAFRADYVSENRGKLDGWDIKRIDEQSARLIKIAKGKLFATAQRMAMRKTQSKATEVAPTREHLLAILGS